MPVAVEAVPYLVVLGALTAAAGATLGLLAACPILILFLFVLFFFRDPERTPPEGDGLVLAPADGRVLGIERGPDGTRVSIFLSVFNCHINRSPVSGTVREAVHTPGRFRPAWQGEASFENERNRLRIDAPGGRYDVTQIAGLLARRIVCRKGPGDSVGRGERIGMIKFGSRTDLHLPLGVEPLVRLGGRVRAGLTVIGREPLWDSDRAGSRS